MIFYMIIGAIYTVIIFEYIEISHLAILLWCLDCNDLKSIDFSNFV